MSSKRRALIFDLAETVIGGLIGLDRRLVSPRCPPEQIVQLIAGDPLWSFCRGEISELDYFRHLQNSGVLGELSFAEFKTLVRSMFDREVDGMPSYVVSLAQRHDLYLLSDHSREWIEYIRHQHPFLSCFRQQHFSYEMRKLKKEGIPFEIVCRSIAAPIETIGFIDDSETNIRVAQNYGLKTFLFKSRSDLEPQLESWLQEAGRN